MTFATLMNGFPGPDIEAKDLKEAIFLRDTFLPDHEILSQKESYHIESAEDEPLPSLDN